MRNEIFHLLVHEIKKNILRSAPCGVKTHFCFLPTLAMNRHILLDAILDRGLGSNLLIILKFKLNRCSAFKILNHLQLHADFWFV